MITDANINREKLSISLQRHMEKYRSYMQIYYDSKMSTRLRVRWLPSSCLTLSEIMLSIRGCYFLFKLRGKHPHHQYNFHPNPSGLKFYISLSPFLCYREGLIDESRELCLLTESCLSERTMANSFLLDIVGSDPLYNQREDRATDRHIDREEWREIEIRYTSTL